ncbi:hypothetical protein [Okeania sp. SIO2B3]|nr:hypothetical protein [Okeania sp. SIO2B3]
MSLEEQEILIDTLQKRLYQQRRSIISQEFQEIRQELALGNILKTDN